MIQPAVCISVQTLYEQMGACLSHTRIEYLDEDCGYYDLKNEQGDIVCLDGEVCLILEETSERVLLQNRSGEVTTTFYLSRSEFGTAVYK